MKKRLIAILLSMAILASLVSVVAYADGGFTITASKATTNEAGEAVVTFDLAGNPGITVFQASVLFDTDALELTSVSLGDAFNGGMLTANTETSSAKYGAISWFTMMNTDANGTALKLTFKAKDGVINKEYPISINMETAKVTNQGGTKQIFEFVAGSVTVTTGVDLSDYEVTANPVTGVTNYTYPATGSALTATFNTNNATNLVLTWYECDAQGKNPVAVSGTQNGKTATYTPNVSAVGTKYYYCEAVNTFDANNKFTAKTSVVAVTVGKGAQGEFSITSANTVEYGGTLTITTTGGSGTGAVTYEVTAGSDVADVHATSGVVTIKKLGSFTVKATKAADGNYNKAEATQTVSVTAKKIAIPAADNTVFTYTGSAQTYGITATADYTVTGATQTNAGTYTVTVSLSDANTTWSDGTTAAKTYNFVINKVKVAEPQPVEGLEYQGGPQLVIKSESVSEHVQTDDEIWQSAAGTRKVTYTLKNTTNYEWAAGSDGVVTFTIAKKDLTITAVEETVTVVKGYSGYVSASIEGATSYDTEVMKNVLRYALKTPVSGITVNATTGEVSVESSVASGTYKIEVTYVGTSTNLNAPEAIEINLVVTAKLECNATLAATATNSVTYKAEGYAASTFVGDKGVSYPAGGAAVGTPDWTYTVTGPVSGSYTVDEFAALKFTTAGEYSVTVKYEDDKYLDISDPVTFTINPIEVVVPSAATGLKYTGSAQDGVVSADANVYTVENGTKTDAGTYDAVAKLVDTTNYVWKDKDTSANQTIEWKIAPKEINVSSWTWSDTKTFTYDGNEKSVVLKDTNTDYANVNIVYTDNKATDVGNNENHTAKATVTAKNGNYTVVGQVADCAWTLSPATINVAGSWKYDAAGLKFTGSEQKVEVQLSNDKAEFVKCNYTGNTGTNVDNYTAKVTFESTSTNYKVAGAIADLAWKIVKADAPAAIGSTISANFKYTVTGEQTLEITGVPANAGEVTYSVGSVTDTADIIGTPTAANGKITFTLNGMSAFVANTKATFNVTVEMDNYADKIVAVTINITDRDTPTISAEDISKTYNGQALTAADIKGTATFKGNAVAGTWSFVEAPEMKNVKDYGTVTVKFTPNEDDTFAPATTTIKVKITKATVTGAPEFTKVTSTGKTLADVEVKLDKLVPAGGTFAWKDASDTKVEANKKYAWTYTVTGDNAANYNVLEGETVLYAYNPVPIISAQNIKIDDTSKGGTITVAVGSTAYGSTVNFTVKAENGYVLEKLSIVDAKGNEIKYTVKADGTFSFVMPNSSVTIVPTYKWSNPFTDVSEKQWYFDAVKYAYQNGLMSGMSNTVFGVGTETTRAMIVTILWRLEGAPVVNYLMRFNDVASETWYTEAVRWAASEKIVSGMSTTEFAPTASITREQLAVMLYNYAQYKGYDVSAGENANMLSFGDTQKLSSWATPAVQWACGSGLMSGLPANGTVYLAPQGGAMREQVASMLMRFVEGNK